MRQKVFFSDTQRAEHPAQVVTDIRPSRLFEGQTLELCVAVDGYPEPRQEKKIYFFK